MRIDKKDIIFFKDEIDPYNFENVSCFHNYYQINIDKTPLYSLPRDKQFF